VLEEVDKGKLVTYAAAALLVVAIVMRLHAHDGAGHAPPVSLGGAPASPRTPGATPASSPGASSGSRELWVDVAGAVRRPGLYKVPAGSRVAAAVERAGGVSRRGDEAGVNLAAPLRDGQQVIVPRRGAAPAAGPDVAGGAASAGPISLSQATEAQLESLDGIGPALAGRILDYRRQHGGFRSIDELKEVSGIGDKRFAALRKSVVP
jgi:competence protein ComEA